MSSRESSTLSDRLTDVRVKKFLAESLLNSCRNLGEKSSVFYDFFYYIAFKTAEDILKAVRKEERLMQVRNFFRWLGFSPVELEWSDVTKSGSIAFGTSRLWQGDVGQDKAIQTLILGTASGLLQAAFEMPVKIEPVTEQDTLPPRIEYLVRFYPDPTASVTEPQLELENLFLAKKEVSDEKTATRPLTATSQQLYVATAKDVINPVVGPGVVVEDVTSIFMRLVFEYLQQTFPESIDEVTEKSTSDMLYPLKVLIEKSAEKNQIKELFTDLGKALGRQVLSMYVSAKHHQLIRGIGLLPVHQLEDLIFYLPKRVCLSLDSENTNTSCMSIGSLWAGYVSEILKIEFELAEEPLCPQEPDRLCLFTLKRKF